MVTSRPGLVVAKHNAFNSSQTIPLWVRLTKKHSPISFLAYPHGLEQSVCSLGEL